MLEIEKQSEINKTIDEMEESLQQINEKLKPYPFEITLVSKIKKGIEIMSFKGP